jgi:hypothetical protein
MSRTTSGKDQNTGHLSTQNVAKLLMLNPERIRQLTNDGYIERIGRNKYSLNAAVQGYIRFLKSDERRNSKSASQSRWQDIKTQKADFELSVLQGQYLPRDDMMAAIDVIVATAKQEIQKLPARLTRDPVEQRRIEAEVVDVLNRISDKIERQAGVAVAGGQDISQL